MNDKILEQMLQIIIRYINITMDDELENMKCDCLHPNQKKGYKEYWRNATKENDCSCFEWNVKGENNE